MKRKYNMLGHTDPHEFIRVLDGSVKNGWELQGGISISVINTEIGESVYHVVLTYYEWTTWRRIKRLFAKLKARVQKDKK